MTRIIRAEQPVKYVIFAKRFSYIAFSHYNITEIFVELLPDILNISRNTRAKRYRSLFRRFFLI